MQRSTLAWFRAADPDPLDWLDDTALLVAHGGLIAGLVTGLMELPTSTWPSFGGLGNCRWAVLARREDHPRWRLAGYNVGV